MPLLRRTLTVLVVSLTLSLASAAASAETRSPELALMGQRAAPIEGVDSMWVWHARPAADLAAEAQSLGIARVFLFVGNANPTADAEIRQSVRLLHGEGVDVFALSGEPTWTFRHHAALAWAHRALALAPFDGLHLDVEPHALPQWRHHQQALIADYLGLLDRVTELPGPLEVDVQFAYGSIATPGGSTFADDILARVDAVTVMSYRDTGFGNNSMSVIATDWLQRATKAAKPIWLAAETNPELDCPYCTFAEEGQAQMASVLGSVDAWARPLYPTYQGISIEDLDGWLALGP